MFDQMLTVSVLRMPAYSWPFSDLTANTERNGFGPEGHYILRRRAWFLLHGAQFLDGTTLFLC